MMRFFVVVFFISAVALESWQTDMGFFSGRCQYAERAGWSAADITLLSLLLFAFKKKMMKITEKKQNLLTLNKQIYSINVDIKVVLHLKAAFNILEI